MRPLGLRNDFWAVVASSKVFWCEYVPVSDQSGCSPSVTFVMARRQVESSRSYDRPACAKFNSGHPTGHANKNARRPANNHLSFRDPICARGRGLLRYYHPCGCSRYCCMRKLIRGTWRPSAYDYRALGSKHYAQILIVDHVFRRG